MLQNVRPSCPILPRVTCLIAADTCECLGDMTPEQSLTVLEMMCWEDQYLMQNYKFYNHTDVEKIGLVLIASKTRLGARLHTIST